MTHIYKILRELEWGAFQLDKVFKGAPVDLADGYIHFSTKVQLEETARKHFSDADKVIVVSVDSKAVAIKESLKWEPSRGGDLFPHLYTALPFNCISDYWTVDKTEQGFDFSCLD